MAKRRPEPDLEIRPRGSTYEFLPLNARATAFVKDQKLHDDTAMTKVPLVTINRLIYIYSWEKGQSMMALAKAAGLHAIMHSSKLIF